MASLACLLLGYYLGQLDTPDASLWRDSRNESPPDHGPVIQNYPVALYAPDFGVIVDQAEYHPHRREKWLSVPYGDPVHPFAWYDLPAPPWPDGIERHQDDGPERAPRHKI